VNDAARGSYVAIEGGRVVFTCSFLADPPPTVVWLLNGSVLETRQQKYVLKEPACETMGPIFNCSAQLTVISVVRGDSGDYTCRSSNSLGMAYEQQSLVVLGKCLSSRFLLLV